MVLTKKYLLRLVKSGRAELTGYTTTDNLGYQYGIVTRFDINRVDHFLK